MITVIKKIISQVADLLFELYSECIVPKFLMQKTIVPPATSVTLFYPLTQLDW